MANEADPKRVFDVTRPSKVAPDASGRPVIVGNKNEVTDPMVAKVPVAPKSEEPVEIPVVPAPEVNVKTDAFIGPAKEPQKEATPAVESGHDAMGLNQAEVDLAEKHGHERLIDKKQYFLHIGDVDKKRRIRNMLIGILFLLILAFLAFDILVDGGVIKSGFKPPIDLIPN